MIVAWSNFFENLTPKIVNGYVPAISGIYVIRVQKRDGSWPCIYVGQALDISKRLLEHLSDAEKNVCLKNHVQDHVCGFHFAEVKKQSDRNDVERSLYNHYEPECNENEPSGNLIEVNLPQ